MFISGNRVFPLLAETGRLQSLGRGFRGDAAEIGLGDVLGIVALVAGLIFVMWLLSRLLARQEHKKPCNNPKKLFRELCKAHELDRTSCQLLHAIATHQRLTQPARLFLEPERFEPANLSGPLKARKKQVARLRERLFAEPAPVELDQASQRFVPKGEKAAQAADPAATRTANDEAAAPTA